MKENEQGTGRGEWRRASRVVRGKDLDFEKTGISSVSRKGNLFFPLVAILILLGVTAAFFVPAFLTPNTESKKSPPFETITDWKGALPREVIARFREQTSTDEKLALLGHPEQVGERAREFFSHGAGKEEEIVGISRIKRNVGGPDPSKYLRYVARMRDGGTRMIMLKIDPLGPKIDFDFYSRYCEVPWAEFFTGPALESHETRIMVEEEHFYQGEFADEQKWQSFKGTSPDLDGSVLLYLRRDHPFQKKLLAIARGPGVRANLALRTSSEAKKERSFEITGINALNWLSLEDPPSSDEPP